MKHISETISKEKDSLLTCLKYLEYEQIKEQNILGKLEQINSLEKNMTIETKPQPTKKNKLITFLERIFQKSNALMLINDDNVNGHLVVEAIQNLLGFDRTIAMQKVMEAHNNGKSYLISDDVKKLEMLKTTFANLGITTEIE